MGMKVNGTSGLTFPDTTTLASAGQSSVQAWVNFNGTGTVAIRASYNVASITDNGTGQYTVNFTTAMPDANYSICLTAGTGIGSSLDSRAPTATPTTSSCSVQTTNGGQTSFADAAFCNVAIFR